MITDKEYPATHSMSTAWFAIDSDGNVGLLDFNENGPVPEGIPDTSLDYALVDTMSGRQDGIKTLPLTGNQAEEILERMSGYKADMEIDLTAIVQIDVARTDEFMRLFMPSKNPGACDLVCLSKQYGLYYADFYGVSDHRKAALARKGIILKYMDFYLDTNDRYDEEKGVVFEQNFEHLPVYLFQQPYWTSFPMRKTYVPRYPLKESQLSARVREKALRLPFRFDDRDEMQIAEYFPFNAMSLDTSDGGEHYLLSVGNGEMASIRSNSLPFVRCGETCNKCGFDMSVRHMHSPATYQYCERPTLAVIYSAHSGMEHDWMEHWPVLRHAVALPATYEYLVYSSGFFPKKRHGHVFENCKTFLEESLKTVSPYALILFGETKNLLAEHYQLEDGRVVICGVEYPFFMYDKMSEVYDDVKAYAGMPYRGEIVDRVKKKNEPTDE